MIRKWLDDDQYVNYNEDLFLLLFVDVFQEKWKLEHQWAEASGANDK